MRLVAVIAGLGALSSAPLIASNTYTTSTLTPPVHPVAGFDNRANLQFALTNTLQNGDTLVFDQSGDFEFSMAGAPTPMLSLFNKSNVTITASVSGVRLLLTNCDRSNVGGTYPNFLDVSTCPGFTLKGFNATSPITFDTQGASTPPGNAGLPFLQGTVAMIASSTSGPCFARLKVTDSAMFLPVSCNPTCWAWTYQVALPPASPPYYPQPNYAQYNGTVVPVGPVAGGAQLVDIKFPAGLGQPFANWPINSNVVAILNNTDTYAVLIHDCSGTVTMRDLAAHHLPGKFVQNWEDGNLTIDNVNVTPGVAGRDLSVNRDGINAGADGLLIQNCTVLGTGDDGIVVGGTSWGQIVPSLTNPAGGWFVVRPPVSINPYPTFCIPGQRITMVKGDTLASSSREQATISTVSQITFGGQNCYKYTYTNPTSGFNTLIGFTSPPAMSFNPTYSTSATVSNCTAAGMRGLGIVVRGMNATISQCLVSDTLECGIQAGGGMVDFYPWWGAGAPPDNLTISACTVTRCASSPWIGTKGTIEIGVAASSGVSGCFNPEPVYSVDGGVIRNVSITGCTIQEFPRAGVFCANVGGSSGIQIIGNTFKTSGPVGCEPEYGYGVAVETCGLGWVHNNLFSGMQAGPFRQHASPNVVYP